MHLRGQQVLCQSCHAQEGAHALHSRLRNAAQNLPINFGPSEGGTENKCELNSATDENKLIFLHDKKSYTFVAIEVNVLIATLALFIMTMFKLEIQNHEFSFEAWSEMPLRLLHFF